MRPDEGTEEELTERVSQVRETIAAFVDEHPLAAVGLAFGAGYVVAGGLVSRTTGRLFKFGTRLALGAVVRQALMQLPAMLLAEREGAQPPQHRQPPQPERPQQH